MPVPGFRGRAPSFPGSERDDLAARDLVGAQGDVEGGDAAVLGEGHVAEQQVVGRAGQPHGVAEDAVDQRDECRLRLEQEGLRDRGRAGQHGHHAVADVLDVGDPLGHQSAELGEHRRELFGGRDGSGLGGGALADERGRGTDPAAVLGQARRVVVTKDTTTIIDGQGDSAAVEGRVNEIKAEIERTDSDWDREKLQERLAKLAGGVCVIKVGAHTEVELKEKKHRIEDAISATRAAIEEGIVAGGGSSLAHAVSVVEGLGLEGDEQVGANIVRTAGVEPLRWIAENAGLEGYVAVAKVQELTPGQGLNAATGEYGDLIGQGVIDPVKVTRSALVNAASIASMVLTTDTLVVDKKEDEDEGHGHSH